MINISNDAEYFYRESALKFMVTDGRRLFVTDLPINYTTSLEQRAAVREFLNNLKNKNNLDVPFEQLSHAEEYEQTQLHGPPNHSPNDSMSFDSVAEANIANAFDV